MISWCRNKYNLLYVFNLTHTSQLWFHTTIHLQKSRDVKFCNIEISLGILLVNPFDPFKQVHKQNQRWWGAEMETITIFWLDTTMHLPKSRICSSFSNPILLGTLPVILLSAFKLIQKINYWIQLRLEYDVSLWKQLQSFVFIHQFTYRY